MGRISGIAAGLYAKERMTNSHLPLERVVDLARGVGPVEEAESSHLHVCGPCRAALRWAHAVVDAAAVEPLERPPPAAVERAIELAEDPRREPTRPRWSVARLLPDIFTRPALAGVRSGAPAAERRLYEAEDAALDMAIAPSRADAERWRITAQLERADATPSGDVLAILWRDGAPIGRADGDAFDVFDFDEVAPGEYRLEAWSPGSGVAVRVESLSLPEVP